MDDDEQFDVELDGDIAICSGSLEPASTDLFSLMQMNSNQAESLDLCMEQLFAYLANEWQRELHTVKSNQISPTFTMLIDTFQNILLPAYNTHHVQFVLFYYISFRIDFAESFMRLCWQQLRDVNVPATIRQAAVTYLASTLSRSIFVNVEMVQEYLQEMCTWIRTYIQRYDSGTRGVITLKAHGPFFATCQALFYVISFRSKELSANTKSKLKSYTYLYF